MEIHETLKELRKSVQPRLTQSELGKRIGKGGYKKSHISNIERGRIYIGQKLVNDWQRACGLEPTLILKKTKTF